MSHIFLCSVFFFQSSKDHSGKMESAFFFNVVLRQLTRATAVTHVVDWNREMHHCRLYHQMVQFIHRYVIATNFAMTLVTAALISMNCKRLNFTK